MSFWESRRHTQKLTRLLYGQALSPHPLLDDIRRLEAEERENRDVENVEEV